MVQISFSAKATKQQLEQSLFFSTDGGSDQLVERLGPVGQELDPSEHPQLRVSHEGQELEEGREALRLRPPPHRTKPRHRLLRDQARVVDQFLVGDFFRRKKPSATKVFFMKCQVSNSRL